MKDVKTILVPVDFSDNSIKILHDAEIISAKFGANLSLIFIVQSFDDYSGFFVPHMPIAQFQDDLLTGARKKMDNFVEDNLTQVTMPVTHVGIGDVAEEIVSYAQSNDVDMVVMGTHGYKGLERVLFGSVAEQVVKTAHCPVLTINPYK